MPDDVMKPVVKCAMCGASMQERLAVARRVEELEKALCVCRARAEAITRGDADEFVAARNIVRDLNAALPPMDTAHRGGEGGRR